MNLFRSLAFLCLSGLALMSLVPVIGHAQTFPTPVGSGTTNVYPYSTVGRITFTSGAFSFAGSGTTVKPYGVLTAGHCVYNASYGWMSGESFDAGVYYTVKRTHNVATHLFIGSGYASHVTDRTMSGFSYDAGGLVCSTRPCGGGYAAWSSTPAYLEGHYFRISAGYGSLIPFSGNQLLHSAPTTAYTQYGSGSGSFFYNTSYRIEPGMDGGPVFSYGSGAWRMCAFNVVGNLTSYVGVHAIGTAASNLIKSQLY